METVEIGTVGIMVGIAEAQETGTVEIGTMEDGTMEDGTMEDGAEVGMETQEAGTMEVGMETQEVGTMEDGTEDQEIGMGIHLVDGDNP